MNTYRNINLLKVTIKTMEIFFKISVLKTEKGQFDYMRIFLPKNEDCLKNCIHMLIYKFILCTDY